MIAIDTNLLVYAHRREHEWHADARACVGELAETYGCSTQPPMTSPFQRASIARLNSASG